MGDVLSQNNSQQLEKEMKPAPNINDVLNNINKNKKVDLDINSNFSESDIETTKKRY